MVIRMRHTRAHTRNRRSHHALKSVGLLKCKKCSELVLPHTACANCGTYKDREVIDILKKLNKKERKKKEKEMEIEKKEKEKTSKKPLSATELSKK